ncbi:MAG: nuclear transport factor 2 family protein [Actinomycetota bacterium]
MADDQPINRYYEAMRRGEEAAEELFTLFTDDAVYAEPFTGRQPAIGIEAIRDRFALMWADPLPDVELDVLGVHIDGDSAIAEWECRSPGLPGPIRGQDRYELAGGRITRLDIVIDDQRP